MSREQERLNQKLKKNPIAECNKIRRKYCPSLFHDFAATKDPRHASYIDYLNKLMLGTVFYKGINASFVESDAVPILEFHDDGTIAAQNEDSLYSANVESLIKKYQTIAQFREETGIQVMAQEFGFKYTIPQAATLAATEDFLAAMEQLKLPWCCWCEDFSPLIDGGEIDYFLNINWEKIDLQREGSEYVPISENWMANRDLLEIYLSYITD